MFVRYFVELALSMQQAEGALFQAPSAWIPGLAVEAESRSAALVRELDFGPISKRVRIEVGEPIRFPTHTALPMTWRSDDALFPVFEADIELAELLPERTQLSISARYEPPLGPVGKVIDRAWLHRIAETTMKDFLDRAALQIEALAGGPSRVPP